MRLLWNGYELEGTPQEITEFIKMNEPVTIYDSNKTRVQSDSSCNDFYKSLVDIPKVGITDEMANDLERVHDYLKNTKEVK